MITFLADMSFAWARRVAFHKLLNFYIKCSNAKTQRYQEVKSKNENGEIFKYEIKVNLKEKPRNKYWQPDLKLCKCNPFIRLHL